MMYFVFLLLCMIGCDHTEKKFADSIWTDVQEDVVHISIDQRSLPSYFRILEMNVVAMQELLSQVTRKGQTTREEGIEIDLPLPNKSFARFRFVESTTMAPELAAKFPQIKTYTALGVNDRSLSAVFDFTDSGFHAMIHTLQGDIYIDPYLLESKSYYICYYKHHLPAPKKRFFEGPIK